MKNLDEVNGPTTGNQPQKSDVTNARVEKVRAWMKKNGYDYIVVSDSDTQINEYVGARWKGRSWLSGFAGSNGTIVLGHDFAGLWTDVRYYLIAESDIAGTEIELFRMNDPKVPSVAKWLADNMKQGEVLAIDGKETSSAFVQNFLDLSEGKGIELDWSPEVLDEIWEDRPEFPNGMVYDVPVKFTGKSIAEKLSEVREQMEKEGYQHYVLGRTDEFNWLFNLKGTDIADGTAIYCYTVISMDGVLVFGNQDKFPAEIQAAMHEQKVEFRPYDEVFAYLKGFDSETTVLIIPEYMNFALYDAISHAKTKKGKAIITYLKAVKNETEIANLRECMLRDGVAMVKSFKWVDDKIESGASFTEWDVLEKIIEFRKEIADYAHSSFQSIVGFNGNGALNHYMVSETNCATVTADGVLLIDAGGQYLSGTSDTTRVLCLSEPTDRLKMEFTTVLRSLMDLMRAEFPRGATGSQLDGVCRAAMWSKGLNFEHSTGHGVGFGLEVHEGPQGFSHRCGEAIIPGMLTTIEPGLYRPDEYGIRLENMVVCQEYKETDFGKFFNFENITFCPFDRRLIDVDQFTDDELAWFNAYQADVYCKLSPYLEVEEKAWLSNMCAEITRS